ncbi:MAG: NAD(P)H-hydrate dehydratase [Chthonomonadales bacterium]
MKIVTAEAMRTLDRRATEIGSIPGVVLMENAGRAVFEAIVARYGSLRGRDVQVFCGTGANGGDGFVVARYLHLAGAWTTVCIAGDVDHITGDALVHFKSMRQIGIEPWPSPSGPVFVKVDALLGTGAKGAPKDETAQLIQRINADRSPTVAVDIPSGINATTGSSEGDSVRAALTVTFAYPKMGLFMGAGADHAGEIIVKDIGFDWDTLENESPYEWLQARELSELLPRRPRDSNKGMFGHVLVVGGSKQMGGAPVIAAYAALRTGSGLVSVGSVESGHGCPPPEVMVTNLNGRAGALVPADLPQLLKMAERADAVCLGPGMGQEEETQSLIRQFLRESDTVVVLDADGLNAVAADPACVRERTAATVLTPHPGECGRLLGITASEVQADRLNAVRLAATTYGAVVALKGSHSLVCDGRIADMESPPVSVNTSGNPGMASGGMGDALTGIVGSLLAQGLEPWDAACLGVYVHGSAGDKAECEIGESGLIASDLIQRIPGVIRHLQKQKESE